MSSPSFSIRTAVVGEAATQIRGSVWKKSTTFPVPISAASTFCPELCPHPARLGAIALSSRRLSSHLASFVYAAAAACVVELGPGTGSITSALVQRGGQENLVMVESSPLMADYLKRRFSSLVVLNADAANLESLFRQRSRVSHIVSSLPLRSLPKWLAARIQSQIATVLIPNGSYIYYTYDLFIRFPSIPPGFKLVFVCRVEESPAGTTLSASERGGQRRSPPI